MQNKLASLAFLILFIFIVISVGAYLKGVAERALAACTAIEQALGECTPPQK